MDWPFSNATSSLACAVLKLFTKLTNYWRTVLANRGSPYRPRAALYARAWPCWERHQEFDFQGFGIHGGLAMAREPKKLDDLFHDTLKDIYFAEKKILTALPKMAKAAHSEDLRAAFEKHHSETEGQVERLERVFDLIGKKAQGKTCDAIIGIVEEGQEVMKEYKGSPALDAGPSGGRASGRALRNIPLRDFENLGK